MSDYLEDFAEFLNDNGYKARVYINEYPLRAILVTGNNIRMVGYESYEGVPFDLYADHEKAFNKLSQCPFVDMLPATDAEKFKMLEHLKFLGTEEAREWSDRFGYIDDPRLPRIKDV